MTKAAAVTHQPKNLRCIGYIVARGWSVVDWKARTAHTYNPRRWNPPSTSITWPVE